LRATSAHGLCDWTPSYLARRGICKGRSVALFCSQCGQPVIPRNPIPLPPLKARIFDLVRRHPGIDSETLRTLVWASDASGGPEDPKVLHVHIHQTNQRLAAHGLRIRGSKSLGYRVIKI
jgi:DNA-binding response OmpR family regulator